MKQLARNAVNSDDVLSVSPLINMDTKGGSYSIMMQQFQQTLNVTLARGHAMHKLGITHYCTRRERITVVDAWAASDANQSRHMWHLGERSYGGQLLDHIPDGYQ